MPIQCMHISFLCLKKVFCHTDNTNKTIETVYETKLSLLYSTCNYRRRCVCIRIYLHYFRRLNYGVTIETIFTNLKSALMMYCCYISYISAIFCRRFSLSSVLYIKVIYLYKLLSHLKIKYLTPFKGKHVYSRS